VLLAASSTSPCICFCSPWGSGGASLGDSGTFSSFSPVLSSCARRSLSLAETPPSVPLVPVADFRSGSCMTLLSPSSTASSFTPLAGPTIVFFGPSSSTMAGAFLAWVASALSGSLT
jgi:hypothetical protein